MKVQFYPKIKVHCWGGFGSQLNALSIVHRLGELFNNRRITLVIHEGGRHNAKFELQDIDLSNFNIELKSDLNSNINIIKNDNKVNRTKIIKYVLRTLGFLNSCDSLEDITKIRPWVLIIRGSYNLFPTETFLHFLSLQSKNISIKEHFDVVIHYRLGDLLNLQEKAPIDAPMLINLLNTIERKQQVKNILILTSDPKIARILLEKYASQITAKMLFHFAEPIEVLNYGMAGKIFIGTNSKMSLWSVWLRTNNHSFDSYLPYIFQKELDFLDQAYVRKYNIFFY